MVFDDEDEGAGPSEASATQHTKILITEPPSNGSGFSTLLPRGSTSKTTVAVTVPTSTENASFLGNLAPVWVVG